MPTTPNPTPPDEDDGGPTVPSSPVNPPPPPTNPDEEWLVHRPNVLDRGVSYPRAEINYVEKFMTVTNKASFFQSFPATQYPHPPMFDGVCPGHWSRQYPDMGAAAALASGSGYFGYVGTGILNPDKWWSTNFVDDPVGEDLPATAVTSKGQYHSKNSALAAEENITALVIVSKDTVSLKWGSSWGLVTKNSTYDRRAADGSIQPELHILPRSSDGSPDLEMLEKDIMNKAPVTGSFVIVDFKRNSYVFTTVDGAHAQYTAIDEKNRPTRDIMPFEESVLPLSSRLSFLPSFSATPVLLDPAALNSTATYTTMPAATVYDRVTPWRNVLTDYAGVSTGSALESLSAAQAQSSTTLLFKTASDPRYFQTNLSAAFTSSSGAKIYSGLIRNGNPTQMVCYAHRRLFFSLGYGTTSVAPTAAVAGKYTYLLTTDNVQQEILSKMPAIANISIGFIYDASVGDFGEVTWLSQL